MKIELSVVPDGQDEDGNPIYVELKEAIVDAITREVRPEVQNQAHKAVIAAVAELKLQGLREIVNKALVSEISKPVQKTDSYGKPQGEPESIPAMIVRESQKWLTEKVNSRGEPASYNDSKCSRAEWIAHKEAAETVKGLVDAEVKKVTEEIRTRAARLIADKLAEVGSGMK